MSEKFLFLDVGDTLLHLQKPPDEIYFRVLQKHNLISQDIKREQASQVLWKCWKELSKNHDLEFKDRYYHHPNGNDGWWIELINKFLHELTNNHTLIPDESVYKEIFAVFDDVETWSVDASFFELQKYVQEKQIGLGIISNWDNRLRKLLDRKGLLEYFQHVIVSAEFGFEKPSLKIFREAERLTRLSGESLIYVGDKLELDYHPPRAIGWTSYQITTKPSSIEHKIEKLSDMIGLI